MRGAVLAGVVFVSVVSVSAEPLPAPTLMLPADQADLGYPEPAKAVTAFAWKAVPGAARYRVVLDFSPTFRKPLHDAAVSETTQMLTGLDVGRYYWRVAAIDAGGAEGPFSDRAGFRVTRLERASAPPLLDIVGIEARPGRIVAVRGQTDPRARVTFNGQPIDVAADGTFNEFVGLRQAGPQEIVFRATAPGGGVTEKRQRVVVD